MERRKYYHRTYDPQNPAVMSIWELGLDTFRRCVLTHQLVQTRTVDGILMLIEQERHGDMVDRSLLKSLLRSVVATSFQGYFLCRIDL